MAKWPYILYGKSARPPTAAALRGKLADCVRGLDTDPDDWTWQNAAGTLRRLLPAAAETEAAHG